MKIAILFKSEVGLVDTNYTAGAERTFLDEIRFFNKQNINCHFFCAAKVFPKRRTKKLYYPRFLAGWIKKVSKFLPDKVAFYFRHYLLAFLDFFYCLQFIFQTADYDIYYAHQVPLLAIFKPQKTVIGFQLDLPLPFFRIFKRRYQKAKYYFCSKYLKQRYVYNHRGLNQANCQVIYNSVDLKQFKFAGVDKRKHALTFLYASSWRREKGIFLLLKSIRLLEKRGIKAIFLIAGSADLWYSDIRGENRSIDRQVRELAAGLKTIKILTRLKHSALAKVYQKVDCLVFPSIWAEPFGISIIEALASGVPVIAFSTGAIPEILTGRLEDLIIKQKTNQALADKIEKICLNPKRLGLIKKECLLVAKKFSQEKRQKNLMNFLKKKW